MALTFTCTVGVVTAGNIKVQTMLIGALGCNLALLWHFRLGDICKEPVTVRTLSGWRSCKEVEDRLPDGRRVYLLARINDRGRKILTLRAMRRAPDLETAQRIIAETLPPLLASVLPPEQLELMRQKLQGLPDLPQRAGLTRRDWIGALGLCLLSFLATFPIAIPFIFMSDAKLALRVSNAVAILMLFFCGYAFGYRSGIRPWAAGLSMVAFGVALVGVAIALGG